MKLLETVGALAGAICAVIILSFALIYGSQWIDKNMGIDGNKVAEVPPGATLISWDQNARVRVYSLNNCLVTESFTWSGSNWNLVMMECH